MTHKIVLTLLLISSIVNYISSSENIPNRARVESCPGCSLNRLPEVRKFIYDDLPNYEGVEFKKIHGAPPELVLLNEAEEELERIPLKELSREGCNDLLKSKGFHLKANNKEL